MGEKVKCNAWEDELQLTSCWSSCNYATLVLERSYQNYRSITKQQIGIGNSSMDDRVVQKISNQWPDTPESMQKPKPLWKVPTLFTSFIGREQDVADICT